MPGAWFYGLLDYQLDRRSFTAEKRGRHSHRPPFFRAGDVILAFLPFKEQRSGETPDRPTTLLRVA